MADQLDAAKISSEGMAKSASGISRSAEYRRQARLLSGLLQFQTLGQFNRPRESSIATTASFAAMLARASAQSYRAARSTPPMLAKVAATAQSVGLSGKPGELPFGELIESISRKHGVDSALAAAVVKAESGFNPRAESSAGAKGLMQLMDGTARSLGVVDSYDPAQNLDGGIRFLASLLRKYGGDVRLALAGYNAGPGAVERYGGVPPYQETQTFVKRVIGYAREFGSTLT